MYIILHTKFLTSSTNGFKIISIPYVEIKLDFTSANSCIVDNRDLNFGEMLPIVK